MKKLLFIVILTCLHLHLNAQTLELYEQLRQQQVNNANKNETATAPFTLSQIEAVNQTFTSKDDYISFISYLKQIGVVSYTIYFTNGHTEYHGKEAYKVSTEPKYENVSIVMDHNEAVFKKNLKSYQMGKINFTNYGIESAASGVAKSVVDTVNTTVSYYDSADRLLFTETIAR